MQNIFSQLTTITFSRKAGKLCFFPRYFCRVKFNISIFFDKAQLSRKYDCQCTFYGHVQCGRVDCGFKQKHLHELCNEQQTNSQARCPLVLFGLEALSRKRVFCGILKSNTSTASLQILSICLVLKISHINFCFRNKIKLGCRKEPHSLVRNTGRRMLETNKSGMEGSYLLFRDLSSYRFCFPITNSGYDIEEHKTGQYKKISSFS